MKKGGLSAGDVAAQYKYKNVLFDVKVDTESNVGFFILLSLFVFKKKNYLKNSFLSQHVLISVFLQILTTFTFTEIVPSTKAIASLKVPDYNSGKVWSFGISYAEIL